MRRDKAVKYFKLAKYQAELFSKDPRKKVGCIFLAPESYQILSMGYNGFPRNIDEGQEQRWEKPEKYFWVEHSERNAIYNASRHGTPLNNSICVSTYYPCSDCTRALIQVGVKTLVTKEPDSLSEKWYKEHQRSMIMLGEARVSVIVLQKRELTT